MAHSTSRRRFLKTAPLAAAAAASLPVTETLHAQTPNQTPKSPGPYKLITGADLAQHATALKAAPGNYNFFEGTPLPLTAVLTVETAKSGKEYEWHEGRDHLFQVLDGETTYEVGGTPDGTHQTKPGEFLAPKATDTATLHLQKGDVLVIPRNTLHRRSTTGSVTFYLISTTGNLS